MFNLTKEFPAITRRSQLTALTAIILLSGLINQALAFTSGSNGSDGALNFPDAKAGDVILFDPKAFSPPLDSDGDNVYHFTTINIPSQVTIRLSQEKLGSTPVVWLATGNVEIDGKIDLTGEACHGTSVRKSALAGAGGFGGGMGAWSDGQPATPGFGPGGGMPCNVNANGWGGSGGHLLAGQKGWNCTSGGAAGMAYGNQFLLPLIGGSGGAGSRAISGNNPGGGAGGGALLIASSTAIIFDGTGYLGQGIDASGGSCSSSSYAYAAGGSGGAVRLLAPRISSTTTSPAIKVLGGVTFYNTTNGSLGRIRIETLENTYKGTYSNSPSFGTPFTVFMPPDAPTVRVTKVAGVPVPPNPTGNFVVPDVTINAYTPVTIEVEGRNVPVGKIVKLTVMPETGEIQTKDTGPLAATETEGVTKATADVTFQHGFSRIFVQASLATSP